MIYFIADTHFSHYNIIRYTNRPFKDAEEMNQILTDNWNSRVQPDDIIYMLGDFALVKGKLPEYTRLVQSLNGYKILIMGNHDHLTKRQYLQAGFNEVYHELTIDYRGSSFNLSHRPQMSILPNQLYLFGHVHDTTADIERYPNALCVSVERINYTPISIEEVLRLFQNKKTLAIA